MAAKWVRDEARKAYAEGTYFWWGPPTTVSDFCEIAKDAVPSYNYFSARKVCTFLRKHKGTRITLAREYSPAVYVTGPAATLKKIAKAAPSVDADEINIDGPVLRLWWD